MYRATDESELQISNAFAQLGFPSIEPEQLQVVRGILERDVFAVLPTGFGKSACYQCLSFLYDQRFPADDPCIVLVITPLTTIMKDQVSVSSDK